MLLRLLFVLLIALNIAVAAWLLLGDSGTHAVEPADAGVPQLKLLAEVPASSGTAPAPPGTTTTVGPPVTVGAAAGAAVLPASARSAERASTAAATAAATLPAPRPATAAPASQVPAVKPSLATEKSTKIETRPVAAEARPAEPDAATSPKRSYRCLAVGPFANALDLRAARTAIAPRTVRSRQRQEQTTESHGWRVFLPAQASRELALAQARRLEAKGIKDYFVVTVQGELQNSVALGLFHDPANARKRRDEVIAAGFPARMSERTETTPVWWLDVVVPEEGSADIRRNLRNPSISARPTGCF